MEFDEMNRRHATELAALHDDVQSKRDSYLKSFRAVVKEMSDAINREPRSGLSNKQVCHVFSI